MDASEKDVLCMSGNLKLRKLPEKIPDPVPDSTDPWSDDCLGRKTCGLFLSKVVSDATEPMTLFVNSEWGSGKSFFLDRWALQLKAEGFSTIAFNVWQDDGLTDPLIALFGQLQSNLHCKPGYVRSHCRPIRINANFMTSRKTSFSNETVSYPLSA